MLLRENDSARELEAKLPDFQGGDTCVLASGGDTGEQHEATGFKVDYFLQPLTDIHLYNLEREMSENSDIRYKPYLFVSSISMIDEGLFVLILACVNFMNLSTARSATRTKEVGMRKVVG